MKLKKENLIGQGNTAEIYRIEDQRIVKLFRTSLNEAAIIQEYNNNLHIQKILRCVPRAFEMISVNDRKGIVYQEVHGTSMLKLMLTHLFTMNEYSKDLARTHANIHRPVPPDIKSVKELLSSQISHNNILSAEDTEFIQRYLQTLPDGNSLCHMDFHPGNLMLKEEDVYILDWMTAGYGDECADVARTSLIMRYGNVEHLPGFVRLLISLVQRHIHKIYLKEYLSITGHTKQEIEQWELPIAAARLCEWISQKEKNKLVELIEARCAGLS